MKQKLKKISMLVVCTLLIFVTTQCIFTEQAFAKSTSKHIIIAKLKDNTMEYHKSTISSSLIHDAGWENIIGYGKKKKIKIDKKATYYLFDYSKMKPKKVSRKKFLKTLKIYEYGKSKEQGVTYYSGMACKITIKNGKCVKIVQEYQP